jgi:MscS family membrane protein
MEKAVNIIRRVLNDHPRIENDHYIFFTDFGAHSLDIMLYFFAKTTVWREYLDIRQEVNLIIMRELKKEGLDIAFPTQTINFSEETLLSFENRGMPPALADVKGVN